MKTKLSFSNPKAETSQNYFVFMIMWTWKTSIINTKIWKYLIRKQK